MSKDRKIAKDIGKSIGMHSCLTLDVLQHINHGNRMPIKQNQSDQGVISSFESLKTAYLIETLTMFRSDPMSADFVKNRDNENKLIDATHVTSIVKAVCAAIACEKENKEAVIAAIKKIADY